MSAQDDGTLVDELYGELSDEEQAELERHPARRAEVASLRRTLELFSSELPSEDPSPRLDAALLALAREAHAAPVEAHAAPVEAHAAPVEAHPPVPASTASRASRVGSGSGPMRRFLRSPVMGLAIAASIAGLVVVAILPSMRASPESESQRLPTVADRGLRADAPAAEAPAPSSPAEDAMLAPPADAIAQAPLDDAARVAEVAARDVGRAESAQRRDPAMRGRPARAQSADGVSTGVGVEVGSRAGGRAAPEVEAKALSIPGPSPAEAPRAAREEESRASVKLEPLGKASLPQRPKAGASDKKDADAPAQESDAQPEKPGASSAAKERLERALAAARGTDDEPKFLLEIAKLDFAERRFREAAERARRASTFPRFAGRGAALELAIRAEKKARE